jgi:hypothetical protein
MGEYMTVAQLCNILQDWAHQGKAQSYVEVDGDLVIDKVELLPNNFINIKTKRKHEIDDYEVENPPGLWQC